MRTHSALIALSLLTASLAPAADTGGTIAGDDASFSFPARWQSVTPDTPKTVAMLVLDGADWNKANGLIKVDVGETKLATAKDMADQIAGADGKVSAIQLDGNDAYKVETASVDFSKPRFWVITFHGGKVFLIMAAQRSGADTGPAVDAIVKSWKWKTGK